MSSERQPPLSLVRHLVVVNLTRPLPELIDQALTCLTQALDARAAFYARIEGHSFEIIASSVQSGAPIEPGLRMALEDTFAALDQDLLLIVAGLLAPRLPSGSRSTNGQARTPVSVVRLASEEVKEPLAILR